MNRVCIVSSAHTSDDVRIVNKQAVALSEAGHEVTLIMTIGKQIFTGIKYIDVPSPRNRLERFFKNSIFIAKKVITEGSDIYLFHDPDLIPLGLAMRFCGKKVIFDSHEDIPLDIRTKKWIPAVIRRTASYVYECIEVMSLKKYDMTITAAPYITNRLISAGIQAHTIANYPIIGDCKVKESVLIQKPSLLYIGTISVNRGIFNMIELANRLQTRLVLAGPIYPTSLREEIEKVEGWKYVEYMGFISKPQVDDILSKSDFLGLAILFPEPSYQIWYPVKLFEYLANSIPVLMSDFPLWKAFVEKNRCGVVCNPTDIEDIVQKAESILSVQSVYEELKVNAKVTISEGYSWESEKHTFVKLIESI